MKASPLRDLHLLCSKIFMSLMAETLCFFPAGFLVGYCRVNSDKFKLCDFLSDAPDQASLEDERKKRSLRFLLF